MYFMEPSPELKGRPIKTVAQSPNSWVCEPEEERWAPTKRAKRIDLALLSDEPEETPDEKRLKFLERNRVAGTVFNAASKCRQKKKMWMQELEQKSSEIFQRNRDLQLLTKHLKEEVARLTHENSQLRAQCNK